MDWYLLNFFFLSKRRLINFIFYMLNLPSTIWIFKSFFFYKKLQFYVIVSFLKVILLIVRKILTYVEEKKPFHLKLIYLVTTIISIKI